jgi:hypothetical protein
VRYVCFKNEFKITDDLYIFSFVRKSNGLNSMADFNQVQQGGPVWPFGFGLFG